MSTVVSRIDEQDQLREISAKLSQLQTGNPRDAQLLAAAIGREHRTTQQLWGGVMIEMIKAFAASYVAGNYDPRNQAICELCHRIVESAEVDLPDGLPYI